MRRIVTMAAACLVLASCQKQAAGMDGIAGFKDLKFGTSRDELIKRGFDCSGEAGECILKVAESDDSETLKQSNLNAASIDRGQQIFKQCTACHTLDRGGVNGIGPNLWSIIGEEIASPTRAFNFSDALAAKSGRWDVRTLDALLASPKAFAPGTKMTFSGLPAAQDRADVIALLNSESSEPKRLTAFQDTARISMQPVSYTLFGKDASISAELGKTGVTSITVGVQIPVNELISLLSGTYGKPVSFERDQSDGAGEGQIHQ